jgi:hypothetical protein
LGAVREKDPLSGADEERLVLLVDGGSGAISQKAY